MINDVRRIVQNRLNSIKTTYGIREVSYRLASDAKMFPHIVYDFVAISPTDMGRTDFTLDIHIWAKNTADGTGQTNAFEIMDSIRDLFAFWNAPDVLTSQDVLPTFYETSGGQIEDPDKTIIHLVLRYEGQTYEEDATDSSILGKE